METKFADLKQKSLTASQLTDSLRRTALDLLTKERALGQPQRIPDLLARLYSLETKLGLQHSKPIFNQIRLTSRILELEARLPGATTTSVATTTRPVTTPLSKSEAETEPLSHQLEKIREPLERARFIEAHYRELLAEQHTAVKQGRLVYRPIDRSQT